MNQNLPSMQIHLIPNTSPKHGSLLNPLLRLCNYFRMVSNLVREHFVASDNNNN